MSEHWRNHTATYPPRQLTRRERIKVLWARITNRLPIVGARLTEKRYGIISNVHSKPHTPPESREG